MGIKLQGDTVEIVRGLNGGGGGGGEAPVVSLVLFPHTERIAKSTMETSALISPFLPALLPTSFLLRSNIPFPDL
jgi:hypothetical protein